MIGNKGADEARDILKSIRAGTNKVFTKPPKQVPMKGVRLEMPDDADSDRLTNIVANMLSKLASKYGKDRLR